MAQHKKAVVNLTAYSLILLLLFTTFIFTYFYYQSSLVEVESNINNEELFIAASSFRSDIHQLITHNTSSLYYVSSIDPEGIDLLLFNTTVSARFFTDEALLVQNVSTLGVNFCSTYNFSPSFGATVSFNGTCYTVTS